MTPIDLMGADPGLATYAEKAKEFGLSVTSGKRPGSITSSGNLSHHDSGSALDLSGPADAMRRFFDFARNAWGSQLEELIYTPGGAAQIKNGRPHTYTGQVAADHYDHVHIADTDPAKPAAGGTPISAVDAIKGPLTAAGVPLPALGAAGDAAQDAATAPLRALFGALGVDGPRLLLEVGLILGGAVLVLWGLVRIAGGPATVASVVPTARAAKAAGAAT